MGRYLPTKLQTDAYAFPAESLSVAKLAWSTTDAVAADDDGILADTATKTTAQTVTTFAAQPACARNITVKSGGTAGDLKASKIIVYGRNMADMDITEEVAVTLDTAVDFTGSKAFKTITRVEIPAQDGTGATIRVGWGVKFGLPFVLAAAPLVWAQENGALAAAPTLAVDEDELEKNVVSFNTAPNGKTRELFLLV